MQGGGPLGAWASAGAERSRVAKDAELRQLQSQSPNGVNRVNRSPSAMNGSWVGGGDVEDGGRTREEELLGDLLSANEQLMEVLALYDDLKRVALEMEASRREVVFNLDPTLRQYMPEDHTLHSDHVNIGGSPPQTQQQSFAAPVDDQYRENDRSRDENEITRKIGFLIATGVKDWTLVMDVCDLTIATVDTAKQAIRALRHEFKYGEPATQLAAIRLWALMLRNSSNTFVSQCTSSKFLNTIEDLCSPRLIRLQWCANAFWQSSLPLCTKVGFLYFFIRFV
ncbi:hypothetical protein MSAN_00554200 [Mycena sanguinolenta]|uniref:VHS domain-containing protein n=1 Tax=Mycena sanguinolenta TaxID=230812 RepID=A0A8H6ZD14_9AGAR|nr:hypothetical protein MSAN_00554200 [Mycena sanguinolenta]